MTGSEIKVSVKKFDRIKHYWENSSITFANNSIWYLYINNFPFKLNEFGTKISDFETLDNLIRKKGCLPNDIKELPENMYLTFQIEKYYDSD